MLGTQLRAVVHLICTTLSGRSHGSPLTEETLMLREVNHSLRITPLVRGSSVSFSPRPQRITAEGWSCLKSNSRGSTQPRTLTKLAAGHTPGVKNWLRFRVIQTTFAKKTTRLVELNGVSSASRWPRGIGRTDFLKRICPQQKQN